MRVYSLTEVGRKALRTGLGESEEYRILSYLQDYKTATDDELDTVADRWVVRSLKRRGLVKELTV